MADSQDATNHAKEGIKTKSPIITFENLQRQSLENHVKSPPTPGRSLREKPPGGQGRRNSTTDSPQSAREHRTLAGSPGKRGSLQLMSPEFTLIKELRNFYAPENESSQREDTNLLKRESIRFHPRVQATLKKHWNAVDSTHDNKLSKV